MTPVANAGVNLQAADAQLGLHSMAWAMGPGWHAVARLRMCKPGRVTRSWRMCHPSLVSPQTKQKKAKLGGRTRRRTGGQIQGRRVHASHGNHGARMGAWMGGDQGGEKGG